MTTQTLRNKDICNSESVRSCQKKIKKGRSSYILFLLQLMSHICSRNTLIKSTTTKNAGELKNVSRFHYIKHIIIVSFTLFSAGPSQHIQNLIISPIEMLRNIQIANFGPFYRSVIQRSPKRLNNISSMYCQTPTQLTLFPPVTRKTTSTKIKRGRPSVLIIALHG